MNRNASPEIEFAVGAMTHPGREREANEDSLGLPEDIPEAVLARKGHLYVVADGMGGHRAGEIASRMAVDLIRRTYYEDPDPDVAASLQRAVTVANAEIYRQAQEPAHARMGATVVAAVARGGELVVANVGDSRAYLLRGRRLRRLTADHTWVAEQVAAGILTAEEAAHHDMRHVVTRSLGGQPAVEADVYRYLFLPGDRLLLCTDGLWETVSEADIVRFLRSGEPQVAAGALVNWAVAAGSTDDATALVVAAGPVRAGVLDRVGRVAAVISPQQRAVMGGIGAVVILALLCGLVWRLFGGIRAVVPASTPATLTVTPSITPTTIPTAMVLPTVSPTATPEPITEPTETPAPISPDTPAPSPTVSKRFCVTEQYVRGIPRPANAVEQPSLAVYKPVLTIPANTLLDDAHPDEVVRGCADNMCRTHLFVKVVYQGQTVWILQWRLGTWQEGECVEYTP